MENSLGFSCESEFSTFIGLFKLLNHARSQLHNFLLTFFFVHLFFFVVAFIFLPLSK